jgi:hypothetical protein
MDAFSTGDVILLTVAAYIAVMAFLRLMRQQRERAIRDVNQEIHKQRAGSAPKELN